MATIELHGPSSHSQTTTAPNNIVAWAQVRNTGGAAGWARLKITGAVDAIGAYTRVRGGATEMLRASASIYTWQRGSTITVHAEVEEMDENYQRIRSLGSHRNFSITVEQPYAPPYIPPWHWEEEEEEQDDTTGPVNGPVNGPPDIDYGWESPEDIEDFEGGSYPDYEPETDWDATWGDPDDFW